MLTRLSRRRYPACYHPVMKNSIVFAFVFVASLTLGAQNDGNIKLPQDPKAILEMGAPFYNYDSATAKPWHLSYHYRLLGDLGNVSAEGKVEYWWAPGKISRVTWTKETTYTVSGVPLTIRLCSWSKAMTLPAWSIGSAALFSFHFPKRKIMNPAIPA